MIFAMWVHGFSVGDVCANFGIAWLVKNANPLTRCLYKSFVLQFGYHLIIVDKRTGVQNRIHGVYEQKGGPEKFCVYHAISFVSEIS